MDYKQAYKQALERAKKLQEKSNGMILNKWLTGVFPELAELDDEKIRKDLIEWFEEFPDMIWRGHYKKDVLAWLEKQDDNLVKNGYTDNKDFIKYADNYSHEIWHKLMDNFKNIKNYYIGCNDVSDIVLNAIIDTCNWLEKQGDKKTAVVDFNAKDWYVSKVDGRIHDMTYNPTDNIEPKFEVGDVMRTLREAANGTVNGMPVIISIDEEYYHCTNELIAIKDQDDYEYPPMNRATAWSEEDERLRKTTIDFLKDFADKGYENAVECIDWLKSFKRTNVGNSSITVEGIYNPTKDVSV